MRQSRLTQEYHGFPEDSHSHSRDRWCALLFLLVNEIRFGPACGDRQVFSAGNRPPDPCRAASLLVYCTLDRLVSVDAALRVTTWRWSGVPDGSGLPFTLGSTRASFLPSRSLHMSNVPARTSITGGQVRIGAVLSDQGGEDALSTLQAQPTMNSLPPDGGEESRESRGAELGEPSRAKAGTPAVPARTMGRVHSCFGLCTAHQGSSESVLSCGYWDDLVRAHRVKSALKLPLEGSGTGGHRGAIRCLAMAQESSLLVTGGEDATCRVWVVGNPAMASALAGSSESGVGVTKGTSSRDSMVCVHVLYGHEAPITCLAVSEVNEQVCVHVRWRTKYPTCARCVRGVLCFLSGAKRNSSRVTSIVCDSRPEVEFWRYKR